MKNFKLLGALALVLALTLTACGSKDADETKEEGTKETETEQVATNDDAEEDAANDDVEEQAADDMEEEPATEDVEVQKFSLDSNECLKFKVIEDFGIDEYKQFPEVQYTIGYYSTGTIEEITNYFNEVFSDLEVDEYSAEIQTDTDYSRTFVFTDPSGKKRYINIIVYTSEGNVDRHIGITM